MAHTAALVEVLKRELKTRGVTYADLARQLELSEASVKRMFSRRDFTLKRLDDICRCAQIEFSELARAVAREETLISHLTLEQEKEIVSDRKLFLVAVCALNHVTFDQIVETYDISTPECVRLLARLDRLKFIELLPGNRVTPARLAHVRMAARRADPALLQRPGAQRVLPLALQPPGRVHAGRERHAVQGLERGGRRAPEAHHARVLGPAQRGSRLPLGRALGDDAARRAPPLAARGVRRAAARAEAPQPRKVSP